MNQNSPDSQALTSTGSRVLLVTSAGTASAVNVIRALRMSERNLRIVATDQDPWAAGLHLADRFEISPSARSAAFVPFLLELCRREKVEFLMPIHSSEIQIIASVSDALETQGVRTLLASASVVSKCDDKREMGRLATSLGVRIPETFAEPFQDAPRFPVFVKPNRSSGSKGSGIARDADELASLTGPLEDPLVQECVEGRECTVDCLVARDGTILSLSPRWRTKVQGGQSWRGETFHDSVVEEACRILIGGLGIVGPCNLQFIQRRDEWIFLEINPRWAAGGLMLTVHAGANLPVLAMASVFGENVTMQTTQPGVRMTRYMAETIHSPEVAR